MKRARLSAFFVMLAAGSASAGLDGCSQQSLSGTTVTTVASSSSAAIDVRTVRGFGKVLVTSSGRSLYLLTADPRGGSNCIGSCEVVWPPLTVVGKVLKAGPGVEAHLLSVFKVSGHDRVAYNGHALYTFEQDTGPGMSNGEGVQTYGGIWWLVSPSGKAVTRAALK